MTVNSGTVIGHRVLTESQVFDIPQEYAGASMQVEVPAGRYPMMVTHSRGAPYLVCSMPGVVVHDSFYNHIGAHGSTSVDKHKGQEHTYHWQPYAHEVAWGLVRDELENIELVSGVEAREVKFTSSVDGRECSTASFFMDGEKIDAR